MRLVYEGEVRGGVRQWRSARTGLVAAVAAAADEMTGMYDSGEVHHSWRLFGSPDQAEGLYLAVRPEFADAAWLRHLSAGPSRLLPSTSSGWLPMSLADLREHTAGAAPPSLGR